jgi:hypothetical protein
MTIVPRLNVRVGESIPIRYSFVNRLKSFASTSQALSVGSISWTSQSPSIASFDVGSGALTTSDEGSAAGIANDAVIGRFTMLQAGICTVQVSVGAVNPTATYVGVVQFEIEAIPTP